MANRALANQERAAQMHRFGRLGKATLLLIATVLSFLVIGLVFADRLYRPDSFVIEQIKIQGKFRYLTPQAIEAVVRQPKLKNFFSLDLDEIKHEVEAMPGVHSVDVRRVWPNTLLIAVQEQRPVMRWSEDKWVNVNGEVIALPFDAAPRIDGRLSGNEKDSSLMMSKALKWRKQFARHGLHLINTHLSERHAWELTVTAASQKDEFTLLLGRSDVDERLMRFFTLYQTRLKNEKQLLKRVDARYPDGVAVIAEAAEPIESVAMNSQTP